MERVDSSIMDKILSVKTTCEVLSTSRTTLWRLNQKKLLRARRFGGRVAYLQSEVEAFIAGLPVTGSIAVEDAET
jgi:predicted DNA-binding transcriptional regulator AlpA